MAAAAGAESDLRREREPDHAEIALRDPELGRLELPFRAFGHEAQIHIAVRAGVTTGVRAEEKHLSQGQCPVHCFQTAGQRVRCGRRLGGKFSKSNFTRSA
jgi:hypothetical protein